MYSGNERQSRILDGRWNRSLSAVRENNFQIQCTFLLDYFIETIGRLTEQIKRFVDTFGADQVKVVVFDDFKSDTEREVRDIMEFLGLDTAYMPNLVNHNANTAMRSKRLAKNNSRPKSSGDVVGEKITAQTNLEAGESVAEENQHRSFSSSTALTEELKL